MESSWCITRFMRFLTGIVIVAAMLIPSKPLQPDISFCELLKNPEQYNGKEVTVRATWRYGYEWSDFYCLDCLDQGKTWLQVPSNLDDASTKALRRIPKAGIVNITVRGIFMSNGHFGHLNGYPYQLVTQRVSNAAVILSGMKDAAQEKQAEKKWACGGENPK